MRSNQEMFDTVAKHLLTQKKKSISTDVSGACLYRGPNGLKCAVGCLIPDDKYTPDIENEPADGDPVRGLLLSLGYSPKLADALQTVHDSRPVDEWAFHLEMVAKDFNLDISVVAKYDQ